MWFQLSERFKQHILQHSSWYKHKVVNKVMVVGTGGFMFLVEMEAVIGCIEALCITMHGEDVSCLRDFV